MPTQLATDSLFIVIHDLVNPKTGKTWKEENLEKQHNIPIGSLVEVKFDAWFGRGACWIVHARLWIVEHRRDCDGTPLYSLSRWDDPGPGLAYDAHHGFGEERLTPIELTEDVLSGRDCLDLEDA